jgi:GNAT superfamily N-acetyltransferase
MAQEWPTSLLSRIEDAGLNASAPPQQRWVDGWLVRFSPGKAQRARCINAVSDGVLPLTQRLSVCEALYREAGLRMLMRMTPFSRPPGLDEALARLGYQRFGDAAVMVCPTPPMAAERPLPDDLKCEMVSSQAYAHIVGELRGTPEAERQAHAQRLLYSPVPYHGVVLCNADGEVSACAQYALEAEMVGLYDVFTAATARGRGLSRWLCEHLLSEATGQGAKLAYLQVDAQNRAARAVYHRLGFADAYAYHYRALPPAPE